MHGIRCFGKDVRHKVTFYISLWHSDKCDKCHIPWKLVLCADNSVPHHVNEIQQRRLICGQIVHALDLHRIHFAVDVWIQQRFDHVVQSVVQILTQNDSRYQIKLHA